MASETAESPPDLLRRVTWPVAAAVAAVVALAWYVTWSTGDTLMVLMAPSLLGSTDLALFFALLVVMMVAMMLPSALPMIVAYHGFTRLEGGERAKPADLVATSAFVLPYFAVWGGFAVVALVGLIALGALGPWTGLSLLVPAGVLLAAGVWQGTRTKEVCLAHCTSPMGFVVHHWRSGRLGALRMGTRHAAYCIGCCWLFMLVLFVAGAMSLVWMGVISIAIFVEKLGSRPGVSTRAIGALLVALGLLVSAQAFLAG